MKAKTEIAWFKSKRGRNGGNCLVVQYFAVRNDGSIKSIDLTRRKVSVVSSMIREPSELTITTKEIFDYYYKNVIKKLT